MAGPSLRRVWRGCWTNADSCVPNVARTIRAEAPVENLNLDTRLAHAGEDEADPARALIPPIHLSVPFRRIDAETMGEFAYSRRGNPTRAALERALEDVEGGGRALAFGSGMAAVTAVAQLLKAGDRAILPR